MGRHLDKTARPGRAVPAHCMPCGVCDNCGRFCGGMHESSIRCYHCSSGQFRHRKYWVFTWCHHCWWADPFCEACRGKGVLAAPREDLSEADVDELLNTRMTFDSACVIPV